MEQLEVGQTLYVIGRNKFFGEESGTPKEYEIENVNSRSVYAFPKDDVERVKRFDKKNLICDVGFFIYKAYLSEEVYYSEVRNREEKYRLNFKLKDMIDDMNLDELRSLDEMLSVQIKRAASKS